MSTFIPIDFNSLRTAIDGKISLSDYYMDYAFYAEGISPSDGMTITFYDRGWMSDPDSVICFDAILRRAATSAGQWSAELKGRSYTSPNEPSRRYFSSFIGAGTRRLADDGTLTKEQVVGDDPRKNKLSDISCFVFAHGSPMPDFSKLVGMTAKELHDFFQFSGYPRPKLENGKYPGDTLVVRGGSNSNNLQ